MDRVEWFDYFLDYSRCIQLRWHFYMSVTTVCVVCYIAIIVTTEAVYLALNDSNVT